MHGLWPSNDVEAFTQCTGSSGHYDEVSELCGGEGRAAKLLARGSLRGGPHCDLATGGGLATPSGASSCWRHAHTRTPPFCPPTIRALASMASAHSTQSEPRLHASPVGILASLSGNQQRRLRRSGSKTVAISWPSSLGGPSAGCMGCGQAVTSRRLRSALVVQATTTKYPNSVAVKAAQQNCSSEEVFEEGLIVIWSRAVASRHLQVRLRFGATRMRVLLLLVGHRSKRWSRWLQPTQPSQSPSCMQARSAS